MGDWKPGIFLLAPLILFGDFQEIHNSFPYSLYTIQIFTSALAIMSVLTYSKFNYNYLFLASIAISSLYNFIFWFGFHIVVTFVCAVIFLILFNKISIIEIYKKIFTFLSGYLIGFITTTIIKWILSVYFFGSEIRESITSALQVRLSAGTGGLNGPLLEYSSVFSILPVPIRAVLLNVMVFASKIVDPRNANTIGILIVSLLLLFLLFKFINTYKLNKTSDRGTLLAFMPIFLIPYIYIMATANHSFNHAVLVYRAIPVSIGFALSLIYITSTSNKKYLNSKARIFPDN